MNRQRPRPSAGPERMAVFDDLYDATFEQVLAYCRRRTRSLGDAEDAAAENYLVAWRKLDDATTAGSPLFWLYGVAARVVANQRRGQDRLGRLNDRLSGLGGYRHASAADDPVVTAVDAADVAAALDRLSPKDREIIRLVAFEQLSCAEAGVLVGLSKTAVRTRVFRARRGLPRSLDEIRRDVPGLPDTHPDERPARPPSGGRGEQPRTNETFLTPSAGPTRPVGSTRPTRRGSIPGSGPGFSATTSSTRSGGG